MSRLIIVLLLALVLIPTTAQALSVSITGGDYGVLDDTTFDVNDALAVSGNLDYLRIGSYSTITNHSAILKFNLNSSFIPAGTNIIGAKLWLRHKDCQLANNFQDNISAFGVDNQTWSEELLSLAQFDSNVNIAAANLTLTGYNDTYVCNDANAWFSIDVTPWTAWVVSQSRTNVSFYLNKSYDTPVVSGLNIFWSKEGIVPMLNVTYLFPPTDLQYISIPYANNSKIGPGALVFNITTNATDIDACLGEFCNSTGCINYTATIQAKSWDGSDTCWFAANQVSLETVSTRFFANNTAGIANHSGIINYSLDNIKPNITNVVQDATCYEVNSNAMVSWSQQDNVAIANSTCIWTYPSGYKRSVNMTNANGAASCSSSLPEMGTYQWNLYLNDSSGNDINYYATIGTRTTGGCSGTGPTPPGPGGGGGGGPPFVPTPLNISLEPIITQETIQALPASQFVALITRPVLGPFNLFQIAIVGAAIYYATRKGRSQQDILLVGAVSIMLIIAIASQLGGLGALQSIIRP